MKRCHGRGCSQSGALVAVHDFHHGIAGAEHAFVVGDVVGHGADFLGEVEVMDRYQSTRL